MVLIGQLQHAVATRMPVADILGALERVKNSWRPAAAGRKVIGATREILRLEVMAAPVT
jgi:hypothetical protein